MSKIKIIINSNESLEILLQKIYDEADMEMNQAQEQINLLTNSSELKDESLDSKTKYSKAINDMLSIKEKMLKTKIEVSRLLSEILKFNGDINKAMDDDNVGKALDFESLKKKLKESYDDNKSQDYQLNK